MHMFSLPFSVKEEPTPNLMKDHDFLEYLEEHSIPEEEKQIAFAAWLKENEDK